MDKKTCVELDICNIIKLCGANGVKKFRYSELEIEFYPDGKENPTPIVSEQIPIVQDYATKDSIESCEQDYIIDKSVEFKAEDLAIMQIADPQRYEELLANPEQIQEFSRQIDEIEEDSDAES